MKVKIYTTALALVSLFFAMQMQAQESDAIDSVIVEKYYVSDANDATDTTGGVLAQGSVTYRVFIDLKPGVRLISVFGNKTHPLKIVGSKPFYNHTIQGQKLAGEFNPFRLKEGVTPLDTWFTINTVSKNKKTNKPFYGVIKAEDNDGSIIGGTNNDGGSENIANGLLVNKDVQAGTPITQADGLLATTIDTASQTFTPSGVFMRDTSINIFNSNEKHTSYIDSNFATISSLGVVGPTESNRILIAQLTTTGKLSFELNVQLYDPSKQGKDSTGTYRDNGASRWVASGELQEWTDENTKRMENQSPWLTYPPLCGCKDKRYLEYNEKYARNIQDSCHTLYCGCTDNRYFEYNPRYACEHPDSCKKLKIYGCMDEWACNYDAQANIALKDWCCYLGNCNNRDIAVVCPTLFSREPLFYVYPNPAQSTIKLQVYPTKDKSIYYTITNSEGRMMAERNLGVLSETIIDEINISQFQDGIYMINLKIGDMLETKKFTKGQ